MIIPIINQRLLTTDVSQEEAQRVASILKENKVEYYQKTVTQGGNMIVTRNMDMRTASSMKFGMSADNITKYVYMTYVKRKDLPRAKGLITK
ncbi:MAG: hypothetical protein GX802_02985 [Clostridiales bacterium]|jgi:hypothetical protein|nr:hypothetical protein [Clostridiales bacterium]